MITELPTEADLETAGIDYLYMALSKAINIAQSEDYFIEVQEMSVKDDWEDKIDYVQEYWKSVQRELAMCASLLQMGTELLLKARIAGISPYILSELSYKIMTPMRP